MELRQLPIASLKANDYNFNVMEAKALDGLSKEVRTRGFLMHHIVARQEGDDLIIVDGEHQWKAAQMAGFETVPVQVIEASPTDAIAESFRRNGLHGEPNRVKLARAILRVQNSEGEGKPLSMVKLSRMFGKTDKWVATQLQYAQLADLAKGREGFPDEDAISKLTEKDMKEWLAFADGSGPNPNGQDFALTGEGEGGESQPKDEPTDEDKARKSMEGVIKKLAKMTPEDRALVAAAIKRLDREAKKAATDKETAEPQLAV
jgi:hypothetical protein